MNDSWDDMRRAKEDAYFDKQNRDALARLKDQSRGKRLSPISGEPMEQITFMGVVIDRDPKTGGIWLDQGELEQIIKHAKESPSEDDWLSNFVGFLRGK